MALTLPTKASPYPFAALATAAFTEKALTTFEDEASGAVLQINGSEIKDEIEIVQLLAKEAGLSEHTEKVGIHFYAYTRLMS
jgi:glutamyl-tRNA synthetase